VSTEWAFWWTLACFTLTYLGLALGKVPGLRVDRAGIALVGATLILIGGSLSLDHAVSPDAIDYKTLALLFGMMIVVGFLRLSGVFRRLSVYFLNRIRSPLGLLAVTVTLSGVISAFLINDIVCLALTPLVLHLARRLRCDPLPHLIALATAANIGSAGTITGNPQNIYIGSHSGIPYLRFALRLFPVVVLGLGLNFLVVALVYRRRLTSPADRKGGGSAKDSAGLTEDPPRDRDGEQTDRVNRRVHRWLQRKSIAITLIAVVLFFTGLPLELIALGAAALLLLGRVNPHKIYEQIDWSLLVMFTGLFIVVHAFQVHVVAVWGIGGWQWLLERPVDLLSLVSAVLSNLVSNVPAVLLMEPLLQAMSAGSRETAWLALAMSSTFAGNLTILGSVANLIVVEKARRAGVDISFTEYCKVGVPLTLLTLALGVAWLQFASY
jgi:Na+/H+ antiporter NhaD/arsenite permease-like protein